MLVTLSYVSRALIGSDERALDDILATAQRRNAAADVTGALYFDGTLFFQVLEGPRAAVQEIFAAIRRDPRHRDVKLLKTHDLPRRRFSDWSMKFVPASALPAEGPRVIHHAAHRPTGAAIDAAIDALR